MTLEEFELTLPEEERWENLTIANDFMFGKVFQNSELCLELIRLILPELNISRISLHELQKGISETLDTKGVRFDVYLRDENNRIIDVEMQPVNRDNLMKRARAYHSLLGLEALKRGEVRYYNDMPEVMVIFICGFDLFNHGRHIYTFRNTCIQDSNIVLDDGASTIFLNTKGKADDVSPRLKAFLEFVEGKVSDDEFVKKLNAQLEFSKQNLYWRQIYMLEKFQRNADFDDGVAVGEKRGIVIGEKRGIAIGEKRGLAIAEKRAVKKIRDAAVDFMRAKGVASTKIDEFIKLTEPELEGFEE